MKRTHYYLLLILLGGIFMFTTCQKESFDANENLIESDILENIYALTVEETKREVDAFMSRMAIKNGETTTLRSLNTESLECSAETNYFTVSVENNKNNSYKGKQRVAVNTLKYKNSKGEPSGSAIVVADERFPEKVLVFNETVDIDLTSGSDADFWKEMIEGHIYNVVNDHSLQAVTRKLNEDDMSLRFSSMDGWFVSNLYFPYNWHQLHSPYTDYTPLRNGQRASAGCVPVAMGMIMAWHQWPLQGAFPRYEMVSTGRAVAKNTYPNYKPDVWAHLHKSGVSSKDYYVKEHIANLLAEIGYKINADYISSNATNAYTDNIGAVFRQMGYHAPTYPSYFKGPTIYEELYALRPILMSGKRQPTEAEIASAPVDENGKKILKYPGHSYIINGMITEGVTSPTGLVNTKKVVYVHILNGNAGSGDGWFYAQMFLDNQNNTIKPDGRDGKDFPVYPYRYAPFIFIGIKPNKSNPGSRDMWRVSDTPGYPWKKMDY